MCWRSQAPHNVLWVAMPMPAHATAMHKKPCHGAATFILYRIHLCTYLARGSCSSPLFVLSLSLSPSLSLALSLCLCLSRVPSWCPPVPTVDLLVLHWLLVLVYGAGTAKHGDGHGKRTHERVWGRRASASIGTDAEDTDVVAAMSPTAPTAARPASQSRGAAQDNG
jgi:hypothetical protein